MRGERRKVSRLGHSLLTLQRTLQRLGNMTSVCWDLLHEVSLEMKCGPGSADHYINIIDTDIKQTLAILLEKQLFTFYRNINNVNLSCPRKTLCFTYFLEFPFSQCKSNINWWQKFVWIMIGFPGSFKKMLLCFPRINFNFYADDGGIFRIYFEIEFFTNWKLENSLILGGGCCFINLRLAMGGGGGGNTSYIIRGQISVGNANGKQKLD